MAMLFVISPVWAATPVAPYVTNTNLNGDGNYTITGTAEPGTTVRITGGESTITATTTFGGTWSAEVNLDDNDELSDLFITSTNPLGERSDITRLNDNGTVFLGTNNDNNTDDDDNDNDDDEEDSDNDHDSSNGNVTALVLPGIVFAGSFGM